MASPRPHTVRRTPLAEVAASAGASDVRASDLDDARSREVTGVTLDSREVRPGDLYAALPGANVHGARFAPAAAAAGAAAVLTDAAGADLVADDGVELPVVVVDRPRAVLGAVSSLVYGTSPLRLNMVGITGTNGKTTTAYLLTSALGALGHHTGLIGTVETRIGTERIRSVRTTPETTDLHALLAVMVEREMDSCVMEVSSHALSQHRVDGVGYDVAVFTNLSQDHLDFHATMEDYFEAKARLFTPQRSRRGVVCVDDAWGRRLAETATVPVRTLTSDPSVRADWRLTPDAEDPAAFTLAGPDAVLELRSALPGDFNRTNTALAVLALVELGEDPALVGHAVLTDPYVPGRMETVQPDGETTGPAESGMPLAVVDYAHTPDAVAAALASLRAQTTGALVAVLGAGGDRDAAKRPGMGAAAARCADVLVVTDDNPRTEVPAAIRARVLDGARAVEAGCEVHDVEGRRAAIERAVRVALDAGPGSTVVVLGKGHETGQEVAGVVHPFDDREELRRALTAARDRPGSRPGATAAEGAGS